MAIITQASFATALRDETAPVPHGLAAWNGEPSPRRFAVYRNNVAASLRQALAERYPATERIVGAEFFAAMAGVYVAKHPPRSPVLLSYGTDFAEFLAGFEPVQELAYLPDVARLEAARGNAYHAADAAPLAAALLAEIDARYLEEAMLLPHPSLCVLRSPHPVVTIWEMNAGRADAQPIMEWRGEDVLVVRPRMTVEVHRLGAGGAAFFTTLVQGRPLGDAACAATAEADDFDLTAHLALMLASGAFTAIRL
ncbi:putative DNA-binding domain-containing protein [Ancylobacter sonchi]|uniref:HvfC/BufC N-terminal domain-containing protein n=1 Tax=Ancylobacter sonchi TaxID=1937790 RepID=UPI001BD2003D|nr:DNA-binding domain-containing protein [Ancylobacter sonchi]MBS7532663.1 putative DNA-binding domain-containing protein [Ancylobacter sonchi]